MKRDGSSEGPAVSAENIPLSDVGLQIEAVAVLWVLTGLGVAVGFLPKQFGVT